MKIMNGITYREADVIGDAETETEALSLLASYFEGTGEDRLYGVTKVDVPADIDWCGEAWAPRLRGIN